MGTPGAVALSIQDLHKVFPGREDKVTALAGVSLEVQEGELFTLLGPSGCGKTTTLRCIAGFEKPSSGRIVFQGQDFTAVPPFRRGIGMVFQSYALFPHLSVFENVAYGLRVRHRSGSETRDKVQGILKLGAIGFGGPAVTIAIMEDEVVTRRQLVQDRCQFVQRGVRQEVDAAAGRADLQPRNVRLDERQGPTRNNGHAEQLLGVTPRSGRGGEWWSGGGGTETTPTRAGSTIRRPTPGGTCPRSMPQPRANTTPPSGPGRR